MHSTFVTLVGCIITGIIGIVVGAVATVKALLWADHQRIREGREREYGIRKGI